MRTYTLLDGTSMELNGLSPAEAAFLRDLRRMAERDTSYFEIERAAIGPGSPALRGRQTIDRRTAATPLYLAAEDIATRAGIDQGLILAPEYEHLRGGLPADGSHISATQAAGLIGISRVAVHKAIKTGALRALRIGNVTIIDKRSAIEYRRRRESASRPPAEAKEPAGIGRARSAAARAKEARVARTKARTAGG